MSSAILIKSGGGGVSSDEVTATRAQVLEGKTALTSDSGDEIATGTMLSDATITNANQLLHGISAYGRHGVKVNGNLLSDATISNNNQMLSGVVAYGKNGTKYTGNIPSMNGSTITPSTAQQTVSCAGHKMNSNVVVNAIPSNYVYIGNSGSTYQIMFNNAFANGWTFKEKLWDVNKKKSRMLRRLTL